MSKVSYEPYVDRFPCRMLSFLASTKHICDAKSIMITERVKH